ncbi:MAG: ABC transporter permease [Armatimonadota bacterium]|nr:ABC transporter permease [Armatimonadota bacterium]
MVDQAVPHPARVRLPATFLRRFARNRAAVAGAVVLGTLVVAAVLAGVLGLPSPRAMGEQPLAPPSRTYPFGTDDLGRDIWSGVLHGARVSLMVGVLAAATSAVIGVLVGSTAGFYGGRLGDLLMRITEFFLVIPTFLLALVLVAVFRPSIWNIIATIGVLGWPSTARLVRAEFLSLKAREFVTAARAMGAGSARIVFREILPNATPPVVVNTSLGVASAILVEAGLSFLGLGDPNLFSWGLMLRNSREFLRMAWWMPTFPGLAIFLTVLSLNLVGDGLNDALNPRLRQRTG